MKNEWYRMKAWKQLSNERISLKKKKNKVCDLGSESRKKNEIQLKKS